MRLILVVLSAIVMAASLGLFGFGVYLGATSGMFGQPGAATALIEPAVMAVLGLFLGALGLVLAQIERNTSRSALALTVMAKAAERGVDAATTPAPTSAPDAPASA
jgi:hypothetical protein